MHACRQAAKKEGAYGSVREPKPLLFFYNLFGYEQLRSAQEHALNAVASE
jgi:hypothetical protein